MTGASKKVGAVEAASFLLAFQLGDLSMSQSSVETEGNSFASVQDELLR